MAVDKDTAELLAESCRILGKWDMTHGAEGHVSFRPDDSEVMLIRGKGSDQLGVRFTRPSDIVEVDFDANTLSGGTAGVRSPSESYLHAWLYKNNPEIKSVIHMHPRCALLLTATEKPVLPIHGRSSQGARLAARGFPTWPSAITIHDDELGKAFAEFMGKSKVALMRGHGITVMGTSVEDATVRALELNELLKLTYEAYVIGEPKPLLQGDIDWLLKEPESNRPRGSAGGEAGMLANYLYYAMVSGERD